MPRLKSHHYFPPTGFRYLQPQTGWDSWAHVQHQSIDTVARALQSHRLANKFLAEKHSWATDFDGCVRDVDEYTATLCVKQDLLDYVENAPPKPMTLHQLRQSANAAAAGVKQSMAGVRVLLDWLGSGGDPVPLELAYQRAAVCAVCPKNRRGNWWDGFTKSAADGIREQLAIRKDLELSTPHDHELGVCDACGCQNQLKVFTPMQHILKGTSEEVRLKFDPGCWILSEAA